MNENDLLANVLAGHVGRELVSSGQATEDQLCSLLAEVDTTIHNAFLERVSDVTAIASILTILIQVGLVNSGAVVAMVYKLFELGWRAREAQDSNWDDLFDNL